LLARNLTHSSIIREENRVRTRNCILRGTVRGEEYFPVRDTALSGRTSNLTERTTGFQAGAQSRQFPVRPVER